MLPVSALISHGALKVMPGLAVCSILAIAGATVTLGCSQRGEEVAFKAGSGGASFNSLGRCGVCVMYSMETSIHA